MNTCVYTYITLNQMEGTFAKNQADEVQLMELWVFLHIQQYASNDRRYIVLEENTWFCHYILYIFKELWKILFQTLGI